MFTRAVARIQAGLQDKLYMGNLDAVRDWGYAPEYVEGMWRMLQHSEPQDYVLATNSAYSVKDFVRMSFEHVGLEWEKYVEHDERYERPTEVNALVGDYSKAQRILGWEPTIRTPELVRSWSMPTSSCWTTSGPADSSGSTHDRRRPAGAQPASARAPSSECSAIRCYLGVVIAATRTAFNGHSA